MFKLTKTTARYYELETESFHLTPEFYLLEDGTKLTNEEGDIPETTDGYIKSHKATLWTYELDGRLEYATEKREAVYRITEWLAEHPNKAAAYFAN